jgi:DNA-binding response OmpR family regulator
MNARCDVLVVDDEPVVRDAIRLVLEQEGFSVACVAEAEAALDHPALATCRLVICDIMLPGRSGLEVVPVLRRRRPELPILIVTGRATSDLAAQTLEAGATAFLAKPFDDTELMTLVRRVLGPTAIIGREERP